MVAAALKLCSACDFLPARLSQRYCLLCHAASMRAWRRKHSLTPAQRLKDNSRAYAGVYKRRGVLIPQPCKSCGDPQTQMHHPDYRFPLWVEWLCRSCHLAAH